MKSHFFIVFLLFAAVAHSQSIPNGGRTDTHLPVKINVWNNSLLPHKYTFIGYTPGETGNWTRGFVLLPGTSRSFRVPVGTKIYRANNEQIGTVMGGGSIRNAAPFITVEAGQEGKFFRLN